MRHDGHGPLSLRRRRGKRPEETCHVGTNEAHVEVVPHTQRRDRCGHIDTRGCAVCGGQLAHLLAPDYDAHVGLITFEYRW